MKRNTVDVITLGCSKNLVDSEKLLRQLQANGYRVTHDSEHPEGEIAVITHAASSVMPRKSPSTPSWSFAKRRQDGPLRRLYVMVGMVGLAKVRSKASAVELAIAMASSTGRLCWRTWASPTMPKSGASGV